MSREFIAMAPEISSGPASKVSRRVSEGSSSELYGVDPVSDARWKTFVDGHSQSSAFHTVSWIKTLRAAHGYDPVVWTTCPPRTSLTNGVVFCRIKSWLTGNRLVSLPFADHCDPLAESPAELDDLLLSIRQRVYPTMWKYLEIRPTRYRPDARTGFCESLSYRAHTLDLRMKKQTLFNRFHKDSIQRKIRRAERERLEWEEGSSESLLKKFYGLLTITRRRHLLPPQPLSWFRALVEHFRSELKIGVVSKGGMPIASIITLSHKKSLVYKYGCSDARFHNCGGMMLAFWNTIQEAKDNGIEELDMGRSDVDNQGLISFKEHWGAIGKPLVYWSYPEIREKAFSTRQKAILRRIVPATPDLILRAAGRMLYRHIG